MGTSSKIRKVQLKISSHFESVLLGLVSTEPDYKLSLSINKKLRISLKNSTPVIVPGEAGTELTFSRFTDSAASPHLVYELTSNRAGKNLLLKKLKNIDFIFQLNNPQNGAETEATISKLRETDTISAVFKLDPETMRDKNLHYLIH
jgi:hypothetical protein